jgi:hypothetical protein
VGWWAFLIFQYELRLSLVLEFVVKVIIGMDWFIPKQQSSPDSSGKYNNHTI